MICHTDIAYHSQTVFLIAASAWMGYIVPRIVRVFRVMIRRADSNDPFGESP